MKTFAAFSLAALAAGCAAAVDDGPSDSSLRAQTQLTEELRGRVAGPPQSCVNLRLIRGNRSVGEGALIFEGQSRDVIYVNRPPAGCPELDSGRALQTRTPSSQLCRGDIATVFDPVNGFTYGSCGLGDFTPYRRVR